MSYSIYTESLFGQPQTVYSGIASGVDTQAIVRAKTAAAGRNQQLLIADANAPKGQSLQYSALASPLGALNQVTAGLSYVGLFAPSTGSSSNPTALPVAISRIAQTGSYAVNVTQLAQAQSNDSDNYTSASSPVITQGGGLLGTGPLFGSVQLQVGSGSAVSFSVDKTTTLSQLAASINSSALGAQVTATVVNDSSGYRLNLVGDNTGSANAITITESNTSLNLNKHLNKVAQNAMGTVNGAAFSDATNVDSAAIVGVTLNFAQITSAPVTVSVGKDNQALNDQVVGFLGSYNDVIKEINAATAAANGDSSLADDSGVQFLTRQLSQALTSAPSSATGAYRTLSDVGVTTNKDGTLNVDTAALTAAINKDASSVANLLGSSRSGTGIAQKIDAIANSFGGPSGTLQRTAQSQAGIAADNLQSAADMQYSIDAQQQTMQADFVQYERYMSNLTAQNLLVQALANTIGGVTQASASNNPVVDAGYDSTADRLEAAIGTEGTPNDTVPYKDI